MQGESSARDAQRAREILHAYYSLCDAMSFAVMERLGLRDAIATDRHFRDFGLMLL